MSLKPGVVLRTRKIDTYSDVPEGEGEKEEDE